MPAGKNTECTDCSQLLKPVLVSARGGVITGWVAPAAVITTFSVPTSLAPVELRSDAGVGIGTHAQDCAALYSANTTRPRPKLRNPPIFVSFATSALTSSSRIKVPTRSTSNCERSTLASPLLLLSRGICANGTFSWVSNPVVDCAPKTSVFTTPTYRLLGVLVGVAVGVGVRVGTAGALVADAIIEACERNRKVAALGAAFFAASRGVGFLLLLRGSIA